MVVTRAVSRLVGVARAQSVTAIRRGLVVAVMRGLAVQLDLMATAGPPIWSHAAGDVLPGIQVDEAGNECPDFRRGRGLAGGDRQKGP